MSVKERNEYQVFLIQVLGIEDAEKIFELGQRFADIEKALNRCPTPWEVVKTF